MSYVSTRTLLGLLILVMLFSVAGGYGLGRTEAPRAAARVAFRVQAPAADPEVEAPARAQAPGDPGDQGPMAPTQMNNGMSVLWSGDELYVYDRTTKSAAHYNTSELGVRADGVVVWRYRADWK